MMDLVQRLAETRTLILVEHKMKLVMGLCRRLVVLHQGRLLAEGTPDDIRAHAEVRRVYLAKAHEPRAHECRRAAAVGRDSQRLVRPFAHPAGISLEVRPGEIVTLVGRNGAGKTTTLKAIMGLVPKREGRVTFAGADILDRPPHERFHRGLAYVPEERRIVPGLTVEENLRLGILAAKASGCPAATRRGGSRSSPRPSPV